MQGTLEHFVPSSKYQLHEHSVRGRKVVWEAVMWPRWEMRADSTPGKRRGRWRITGSVGLKSEEAYFTDMSGGLQDQQPPLCSVVLHWCGPYQLCSKSPYQHRCLMVKPGLHSGHERRTTEVMMNVHHFLCKKAGKKKFTSLNHCVFFLLFSCRKLFKASAGYRHTMHTFFFVSVFHRMSWSLI